MKNADLSLNAGLLAFALKTLPVVGGFVSGLDGLAAGWGLPSISILLIGVGALLNLME